MSDIVEATYKFLDSLDNSELIKNLTMYKDKLLGNKEILFKINDIKNETNSDNIISKRKELYLDNDYKMYMKYYNELSLIIMRINQKYKKYTVTREHNCS